MKHALIVILASFVMLVLCTSCLHPLETVNGYSRHWEFLDIEIPDDCQYIERESWTYIAPDWPSFRIGEGTFVGETRRDVVIHRYGYIMPRFGFKLIKQFDNEDLETSTLTFYHEIRNELVEIDVSRTPDNLVKVQVEVKPN